MNTKNRIFYFLLFIYLPIQLASQINTHDLGSWAMFFNQSRIHTKWSIHSEVQFRSYDVQPNTEQLLLRGGINYHHRPNLIFTAGYGWISNYSDDGNVFKTKAVNENRLWEQITLKNNIDRVFLEHRYRIEQRWIEQKNNTNYRNRIRYLLRITIPINNKEIVKNTFFVSVYDEIFIHINNTPFDRNRLYSALGYQLNSTTNLQIGYLLQTVNTLSKQYLQLGINFNPDLCKKSSP